MLADYRDKVMLRRVDRHVHAQRPGPLELVGRPRGAENRAAHRVGNLCRRGADAAADGLDQDRLSGAEPSQGDQGIVCGQEDLGNRRRRHEVEVSRDRHGHSLMRHQVLGLCSPGHDPEDTIANLERPDHVRPKRVDLARVLQTGNVRGNPRGRRVKPAGLQQVGSVHAAGSHAHANLVSPRLGS